MEETEKEGGVINTCEENGAKSLSTQSMDFWKGIEQDYLRLICLPLTVAFFLPTERQAGRAENLGALLSLSFFLLSWLPGATERAMGSALPGLENQEAGVGKYLNKLIHSCQRPTSRLAGILCMTP